MAIKNLTFFEWNVQFEIKVLELNNLLTRKNVLITLLPKMLLTFCVNKFGAFNLKNSLEENYCSLNKFQA